MRFRVLIARRAGARDPCPVATAYVLTTTDSHDARPPMHLSLLYASATVLLASVIGTCCPAAPRDTASLADRVPVSESAGPATARVDVATRYAPLVQRLAANYLDGSESPDRAWSIARSRLLDLANGGPFVSALERGDLQSAVRLLPALHWPDGSAVTI